MYSTTSICFLCEDDECVINDNTGNKFRDDITDYCNAKAFIGLHCGFPRALMTHTLQS